ncbi:MAG: FKBP-type peptidyl-prolyl cis-trans isomerase SlpA [Oceanicoccus sp.]|jgi:FKBP-type peptidyl-prolyl cis-trans isomerase SlpA
MKQTVIGADSRVTLHFSLSFEDGTVIDSTFDKQPASFTIGDGSLLIGFETKLQGLTAGQKNEFIISPEQGFGQPNPNNVQQFSRKDFADDVELTEGLVISFADASQSELPGVVRSVEADVVMVDFNHPLAGRNIVFKIDIIEVEAASSNDF